MLQFILPDILFNVDIVCKVVMSPQILLQETHYPDSYVSVYFLLQPIWLVNHGSSCFGAEHTWLFECSLVCDDAYQVKEVFGIIH